MSKGWYPVIDYEKCVGCMACNDMCRHGVYKPDGKKPKVVYGNGCIHGCHGCENKCPVGAIHYFGDDGILEIDYDYGTYKPEIKCEGKPKVAFVCVHNSCRSQIAEALGKKLASDVFESYSAGTELKDHINPDVVVFMGCNVSCPNVPSQYAENWGLDDPTGKEDEQFMQIIEQIESKIRQLRLVLS